MHKQYFGLLFVAVLSLGIAAGPAWAHRPHDVVTQMELSPGYDHDKTLFIIVRGNLLKSVDGGATWTRLTEGLDNVHDLSALAVSRANAQRLYVSSSGDGVFRSDDGGRSWSKVNAGLADLNIDVLAISAHSDDTIFAGGPHENLYRSDDAGQHWLPVLAGKEITAIAFAADTPTLVMLGERTGVLSVSADHGQSWREISHLPDVGAITSLAISPQFATDHTLIVGTDQGGVFKSVDQGVTFAPINQGLTDKSMQDVAVVRGPGHGLVFLASGRDEAVYISTDLGKTWMQKGAGLVKDSQADDIHSPHWGRIRVAGDYSQTQSIFLGGFNGLFKSMNGGKAWQELETLARGAVTGLAISPDYTRDSTLAVTTYVGNVYVSRDQGKTWLSSSEGLEVPRFTGNFKRPKQDPRRYFDVAFSPSYGHDESLFATVLYSNILRSDDKGETWEVATLPAIKGQPTRGLSIVPTPHFAESKIVYAGTQYGAIYRSTDAGRTFALVGQAGKHRGGDNLLSLVISPNFKTDRTLYAAGDVGIHQSTDGGVTWRAIAEQVQGGRARFQLAISPDFGTDGTLILGTSNGVFISNDRAQTWRELRSALFGAGVYVEAVAVSPDFKNDRTLIITTRGRGSFKSSDGGNTFTRLGNNQPVLARLNNVPSAGIPIRFSPNYAQDRTLFGFGSPSSTDLYKSTDGGATWQVIAIPRVVHADPGLLTRLSIWMDLKRQKIGPVFTAEIAGLLAGLLAVGVFLWVRISRRRFARNLRGARPQEGALGDYGVERL